MPRATSCPAASLNVVSRATFRQKSSSEPCSQYVSSNRNGPSADSLTTPITLTTFSCPPKPAISLASLNSASLSWARPWAGASGLTLLSICAIGERSQGGGCDAPALDRHQVLWRAPDGALVNRALPDLAKVTTAEAVNQRGAPAALVRTARDGACGAPAHPLSISRGPSVALMVDPRRPSPSAASAISRRRTSSSSCSCAASRSTRSLSKDCSSAARSAAAAAAASASTSAAASN